MANVVLIEPTPLEPPIKFTYRAYAPLAILAIASPLLQKGYTVKIIDQRINPNWGNDLLDSIDDETLCVGITSMTGRQLLYALKASELVRRNSSVPVVWGGIHASLLPGQTLENPNIDFVVQGEGEHTFLELVQALAEKNNDFNIDGLWHKHNGSTESNPPRKFLDINALPRLPFDLVNLKDYDLDDAIPMFTSRGCAHRCGFCYNLQYCNRTWRAMTPDRVIEDLEFYLAKYGPNKIIFRDDNFFQDLQRARRICERIIKKGFNFRWRASCRIDYLKRFTKGDFALLKESGFEDFGFGMESGSPKMLTAMKKDITVQDIRSATKQLTQFKFLYSGSFIGGYPGETEKELDETINLITELLEQNPLFTFAFFIYVPYPGTDAHDKLMDSGFRFPEKTEGWASFHFAHDMALPGVGKNLSFYAEKTPWLSNNHKRLLFYADSLCQVAGRPLYQSSSFWATLFAIPYNFIIHTARYRWRYKIFGPVPEKHIIDLIRSIGLFLYKKIKGKLPHR